MLSKTKSYVIENVNFLNFQSSMLILLRAPLMFCHFQILKKISNHVPDSNSHTTTPMYDLFRTPYPPTRKNFPPLKNSRTSKRLQILKYCLYSCFDTSIKQLPQFCDSIVQNSKGFWEMTSRKRRRPIQA